MADSSRSRRTHLDLSLIGLRAEATSAGLIQLIRELRDAGLLSPSAIHRITERVVDDLAISRPLRFSEAEFKDQVRTRIERLLREDGE